MAKKKIVKKSEPAKPVKKASSAKVPAKKAPAKKDAPKKKAPTKKTPAKKKRGSGAASFRD